jgi:hypothetical protein
MKINLYTKFILFVLFVIILSFLYTRVSYFEKDITVIKKTYLYLGRYGRNVIEDENGNIYVISNSLYYGFFTAIELYTNIKVNTKYTIKGFGYRIPFLGIYPNVISTSIANN